MYRDAEQRLSAWFAGAHRKPLVIRGARQVGKSTLVRRFCAAHGVALYEINLEKHRTLDTVFATLDVPTIIREIQVVIGTRIVAEGGLLFLDEIQATPHAIAALRYFYEETPELSVVAAGSLLEFALSEHSFSMPVGRIEYLRLSPVTFAEYLGEADPILRECLDEYRIGAPFPDAAHEKLLVRQREFLVYGGMPEVIQAAADGADFSEIRRLQRSIVETFRDDFAKYAAQTQLVRLQILFDSLPRWVGRKVIYRKMVPETPSNTVRAHLDLLMKAELCRPVFHTDASGVPLAAQIDRNVYKPLMVDVGLMTMMTGLDWPAIRKLDSRTLVNEGSLAEQFVGQQLAAALENTPERGPYYWLREKRRSNAEVDFLLSQGMAIIPIEVKAGRSGTLKSLHQFVHKKGLTTAVRFDLNPPSEQVVETGIVPPGNSDTDSATASVRYRLISLPLHFAGESLRLLEAVDLESRGLSRT